MVDTERARPRSMFVEEAIGLALDSRWEEALAVNRNQLEKHGPDEEAYNRIGKALSELGRHREALEAYTEALAINPLNAIAQKNSRRLQTLLETPVQSAGASRAIDVDLFAEEPGRSAHTVLIPPAETLSLALAAGDPVDLAVEGSALTARTERGVPLGTVEAKLARRLAPLMASGNRYAAVVARHQDGRTEIMIQETHQSSENAGKASFPISRSAKPGEFRPYAKESLMVARELGGTPEPDEEESSSALMDAADDEPVGLPSLEAGDLEEHASLEDEDDGEVDDDLRPEDEY